MATINREIFQKFRHAKKLPVRQEGDGHEGQIDIREDEEQSVKLQEITDLLVAAGYFRARIKGLSPFDKIVGGMTWCIESCNIDLDVDLLFQENSTIGQKIALTEKIVAVLPKMKCPHIIEPHQIQGLDCIHIFPVVQWLVKRSMEFRQEISSFVRAYAINQFDKYFLRSHVQNESENRFLTNVNIVQEKYRPRRYYKLKTKPPSDTDMDTKVQLVLLEYDHRATLPGKSTTEVSSPKQEQMEELLNAVTVNESSDDVMLNEEDLKKHYASLKREVKFGGVKLSQENQKLALEENIKALNSRHQKLENEKRHLEEEVKEMLKKTAEIKERQKQANRELAEFKRLEKEKPEEMKKIEELVKLYDSLQSQESHFRQHCKAELIRLKNSIEEAKTSKKPFSCDSQIDKDLEIQTKEIKDIRLNLAQVNKRLATVQRHLDNIPDRSELAQYQTRFYELYNQISSKHRETKQYYTLYNTLEDTRVFMQKELSLLNSVSDSYPQAIQSTAGKEEFMSQFQRIVEGVRHSRLKVEQKLAEEKKKRDQLNVALQGLLTSQRRYVSAIKQLAIECKNLEMAKK